MSEPTLQQPAFTVIAEAMPRTVKQLLLDNCDPRDVAIEALLADLKIPPLEGAKVMSEPAVLNPALCAVLRDAVDRKRDEKVDTVDGAPDHQLNIGLKELVSFVGHEAARALCALPGEFVRRTGTMAAKDVQVMPHEIFVRRYSGGTRPWNPFHNDRAALTVNVALSDDRAHGGGKLLAILDGEVRTIVRAEGEATVHDSRLLHAVTRVSHGVRYSLIIFFGKKAVGAAGEAAETFERFIAQLSTEERERLKVGNGCNGM